MNFWMFASMLSTASLSYSVIRFIRFPIESGIIMIFAPASTHPVSFALSDKFLLNRLMDFYSPSKFSGILRMALLNIFMPSIDVYSMGTDALYFTGVRSNGMTSGMVGGLLTPHTHIATVPPLPPLRVVPVEVYEETDPVD